MALNALVTNNAMEFEVFRCLASLFRRIIFILHRVFFNWTQSRTVCYTVSVCLDSLMEIEAQLWIN